MIFNVSAKSFLSSEVSDNSVDLIYIDPPYMINKDFMIGDRLAFSDKKKKEDYRKMMCDVIYESKKSLKNSGVIAIHIDWHVSLIVHNILDSIFGSGNFVNKIVWSYKTGGSTNKRFSRKHDEIIIYSKTKSHKFNSIKEKSYNRGLKPYRFKGVEEFQDEIGWYTMVNMKDVWVDIPALGRTSSERTGYPTQKPLALADRLIQAFTDEGDLVVDPMCGSGFIGKSCVAKNRLFMINDQSEVSIDVMKKHFDKELFA